MNWLEGFEIDKNEFKGMYWKEFKGIGMDWKELELIERNWNVLEVNDRKQFVLI